MKITINPEYKQFTKFVESIPERFDKEGEVIYRQRNEIRVFNVDNELINVKRFRIPNLFNRIVYSFFRPTKAERSYKHSSLLKEKEIDAPIPVAYIEEKTNFLLSRSYYVSTFLEYPGIMREAAYHPLEEIKELADAFARFTAFLHEKEVLHLDYSPGNILYKKTGYTCKFAILDTNRMKFGNVNWNAGCYNLRRLWGSNETIAFIAREYARARGFDEAKTEKEVLRKHAQFWKKHSKKHKGAKPYKKEL
jgi:aminoglycoside phosphotransferase (APT) family kinase protein